MTSELKGAYFPNMVDLESPQLELSLRETLGDNVEALKWFAAEHYKFKMEVALFNQENRGLPAEEAERIINYCIDEIRQIEAIDAATVDEDTLNWLKNKASGHLLEVDDFNTGNSYAPPSPEQAKLLEQMRQREQAA